MIRANCFCITVVPIPILVVSKTTNSCLSELQRNHQWRIPPASTVCRLGEKIWLELIGVARTNWNKQMEENGKASERCFKWIAKLQFRKLQQHFFNFASLSQPKIAVQIWGPNLRPIDVQSMAANTLKLWSCRKGFGKTACSTVIYHVKPLFLGLLFNSC